MLVAAAPTSQTVIRSSENTRSEMSPALVFGVGFGVLVVCLLLVAALDRRRVFNIANPLPWTRRTSPLSDSLLKETDRPPSTRYNGRGQGL